MSKNDGAKLFDISDYLMSQRGYWLPYGRGRYSIAELIECKDGFSLSVQASQRAYCSPRTNTGPWTEVEVGFPSEIPHEIMSYAEDPKNPTETVYRYVPVGLVEALIESHGGISESAKDQP